MSRPDRSIAFLRSHGFSVFRFPRASAQPLELMHREGKDLTRLGMVPDLVNAGAAARTLSSPRAMHPPGGRGPVFLEARGAFVRVAHEGAK